MTEIGREAWRRLGPQGPRGGFVTTVRSESVNVETDGAYIEVHPHEDGIDVRVEDVQFIVMGQRVIVVQKHPPYPIKRWTILWEGRLIP